MLKMTMKTEGPKFENLLFTRVMKNIGKGLGKSFTDAVSRCVAKNYAKLVASVLTTEYPNEGPDVQEIHGRRFRGYLKPGLLGWTYMSIYRGHPGKYAIYSGAGNGVQVGSTVPYERAIIHGMPTASTLQARPLPYIGSDGRPMFLPKGSTIPRAKTVDIHGRAKALLEGKAIIRRTMEIAFEYYMMTGKRPGVTDLMRMTASFIQMPVRY